MATRPSTLTRTLHSYSCLSPPTTSHSICSSCKSLHALTFDFTSTFHVHTRPSRRCSLLPPLPLPVVAARWRRPLFAVQASLTKTSGCATQQTDQEAERAHKNYPISYDLPELARSTLLQVPSPAQSLEHRYQAARVRASFLLVQTYVMFCHLILLFFICKS